MSASRRQLADARRKLSAAEARLEVAERELRGGGGAGGETSLAYLRSVIIKYIEEEDGTASADSLFQVLAIPPHRPAHGRAAAGGAQPQGDVAAGPMGHAAGGRHARALERVCP